mgnify:CR=1 FL=1
MADNTELNRDKIIGERLVNTIEVKKDNLTGYFISIL